MSNSSALFGLPNINHERTILTPEILRTFIKRIEVGEREKKYSRNASQDITIYYRDVGAMDELPQQRAEEDESAKNSQEIA